MRTRHDQLGKQMLRAGLEDRGTFTPAMKVSPDPQEADGFFVPDLSRVSPVIPTLLGRMTEITCSFEVFSSPPDVLEMEGCIRLWSDDVQEVEGWVGGAKFASRCTGQTLFQSSHIVVAEKNAHRLES